MNRKLVKQGSGTLMVSLPSKWVHELGLEKGSEVALDELDLGILISANPRQKKTSTRIALSTLVESHIRTLITAAYRQGFDRIEVAYEDDRQYSMLARVVKTMLVGFDIVSKEKNKCILESITEPSEEQFDSLLSKIFLNISLLFDVCIGSLERKPLAEDIDEIEERIQKYDNFCRRVLVRQRLRQRKPELLWSFLTLLIHAQRELYLAHTHAALQDNRPETITLLHAIKQMYDLLIRAYEKKDVALLSKVHSMEKQLVYQQGYALLRSKKDAVVVYHILSCARQCYQANSPLVGILLH